MAAVHPVIADGERITGEGDLGVTLLADLHDLGVADVRSAPGGIAPLKGAPAYADPVTVSVVSPSGVNSLKRTA